MERGNYQRNCTLQNENSRSEEGNHRKPNTPQRARSLPAPRAKRKKTKEQELPQTGSQSSNSDKFNVTF